MATTTTYTPAATLKALSDPDKPIFATHGDQLADNHKSSREWIGKSYTPTDDHDHDGVNSAPISFNIATGDLKTTTSSVFTALAPPGATLTPTNTAYAFRERNYSSSPVISAIPLMDGVVPTTVATAATLILGLATSGAGNPVYAVLRYVQASPPYALGRLDGEWGLFLFLHRKKAGEIISAVHTYDPPWEGEWSHLPKGHPARLAQFPHPFTDYWNVALPDDEEIVLVDLRHLAQETVEIASPAERMRANLVAQRDKWLAEGMDPNELAGFENEIGDVTPSAIMRKIDALEHLFGDRSRALVEVMNGVNPFEPGTQECTLVGGFARAAQATHEIREHDRAKLPRITIHGRQWAEHVRVLRCPSLAI